MFHTQSKKLSKRTCRLFIVFLCLSWVLVAGTTGAIENDPEISERFLREAPVAWERAKDNYIEFCRSAIWKRETKFFRKSDDKDPIEMEYTVWRWGDKYGKVIPKKDSQFQSQEARVFNQDYFAALSRPWGSDYWSLTNLGKTPGGGEEQTTAQQLTDLDFRFTYFQMPILPEIEFDKNDPPLAFNPLLLGSSREKDYTWLGMRNGKVQAAKHVDYDGKKMVEVEFSFNKKQLVVKNKRPAFEDQIWHCRAIFDPSKQWCLRYVIGGKTDDPNAYMNELAYTYQEIGDVQLVSHQKMKIWQGGRDPSTKSELIANAERIGKTPSDYTLTAFGLPEPDWYEPPRPWWIYTSLAGLSLLVVGAMLFRYGKRNLS